MREIYKISYLYRMRARATILAIAWAIVLYSLFFMPGIYVNSYFSIPASDASTYWILIRDFLGLIFNSANKVTLAKDPLEYYLTISSNVLSAIADLYFFLTPLIVLMPASLRIGILPVGKLIRYCSLVLLFIWALPILNNIHPILHGVERLEVGFYSMAWGYMLAMLCILYGPKQPERGPAFPVEVSPSMTPLALGSKNK